MDHYNVWLGLLWIMVSLVNEQVVKCAFEVELWKLKVSPNIIFLDESSK